MDLITNLYTRSCFDSRLTFGDDCPKIIETFVKCVYEPYYTKNGDLPSIFFDCVHGARVPQRAATDKAVYIWSNDIEPTMEEINKKFNCSVESYENYDKYCELTHNKSKGWVGGNQYIFWTEPFNAKCAAETIAVFLIPLFDFVCTAKEIKNKFKSIVDEISQGLDDKLYELAEKISEEKGLSKVVLNAQIADLAQYKKKRTLDRLHERIKDYESDYRHYVAYAAEVYEKLLNCQKQLSLYNDNDNDNAALIDMLTNNSAISDVKINEGVLEFVVCNPITQYDEDAFAEILKSENSTINNMPSVGKDVLCWMVDGRIDLLTECKICINLNSNSFDACETNIYGYMPHPHLALFSCFGGFRVDIATALVEGNICYAIQLILTASQNLNFMDSTVMSKLGDLLNEADYSCIMDKESGEVMTVDEWNERRK
jgi:hypothetical protein|nr:MAG TPA: hypothetical protein [Caudoviricetes sp.]